MLEKCSLELNKFTIKLDTVTSPKTGFGTPYGYSPAAAAAPAYGTCFLFALPVQSSSFHPPSPVHNLPQISVLEQINHSSPLPFASISSLFSNFLPNLILF